MLKNISAAWDVYQKTCQTSVTLDPWKDDIIIWYAEAKKGKHF